MPGGYLQRFDGGESKWRKDYHRSDVVYGSAVAGGTTVVIFNNTNDTDFLISAAFLSMRTPGATAVDGDMFVTDASNVVQFSILYTTQGGNRGFTSSISFPMPLEIKAGYKVKISSQTGANTRGWIFGAQEDN